MFCFDVIRLQPFIVWLLKRLGLSCIPLKERKSLGRKLVRGPLELRFSATPRCNNHGKTRKAKKKTENALDRKIRKTPIFVDKNRKPKTKLEKTRKPHKTPKPKNWSFKCEKRKTEPKSGQILKTENPNAPLNTDFVRLYDARKFLLRPLLSRNLSQNKSFSIEFGYDCRSVLKHV